MRFWSFISKPTNFHSRYWSSIDVNERVFCVNEGKGAISFNLLVWSLTRASLRRVAMHGGSFTTGGRKWSRSLTRAVVRRTSIDCIFQWWLFNSSPLKRSAIGYATIQDPPVRFLQCTIMLTACVGVTKNFLVRKVTCPALTSLLRPLPNHSPFEQGPFSCTWTLFHRPQWKIDPWPSVPPESKDDKEQIRIFTYCHWISKLMYEKPSSSYCVKCNISGEAAGEFGGWSLLGVLIES